MTRGLDFYLPKNFHYSPETIVHVMTHPASVYIPEAAVKEFHVLCQNARSFLAVFRGKKPTK